MISIQRDEGLVDKVHLSLRFGFENHTQSLRLVEAFNKYNIPCEVRPPSRWSNEHKVNIPNLESASFSGQVLNQIIKDLQIVPNQFDFFLGITSAYQLGGFTVPDNVVEYIRVIGGKVEISYSCSYSHE